MLPQAGVIGLTIVLVTYSYNAYFTKPPAPVITTNYGQLSGSVSTSREGRAFHEYLGIPYAQSPVGNLRFEPPHPPTKWDGVRDGTKYGNKCLQFECFVLKEVFGSEDCLFLNVFVPQVKSSGLLPVLVVIHGGIFHVSAGSEMGPDYFMDEDVVVVTLNYRLGVFGFLNTGDKVVRGNMGLKDQNMALKWVQSNIRVFGGDPNRVTIFGPSAGGASVHYHVLSPKSKGLFHKAIPESGSALNYWSLYRYPKEQAKRFAAKFNCPVDNSESMVKCMKEVEGNALVAGHSDMQDLLLRRQISTFVPTIESVNDADAFLAEDPVKIITEGRFSKVPVMFGVCKDEGLLLSAVVHVNATKRKEANDNWLKWSSDTLHFSPNEKASQKIREFYFGSTSDSINKDDSLKGFTDMFGDRLFNVASVKAAQFHAKHAQTYFYVFSHASDVSATNYIIAPEKDTYLPIKMSVLVDFLKRWVQYRFLHWDVHKWGANHGEATLLMYPVPIIGYVSPHGSPDDYRISKDLVKLQADFVRNEPVLKFRGVEWPSMTSTAFHALNIDLKPLVLSDFRFKNVKFWESLDIKPQDPF